MHQLLGGFPHEKRLADTIFTDTMKRFEKCTDEELKEAETYCTETVEHFVYLIRRTIELQTGYLPTDEVIEK